ncbi:hypothetical protein SBOR_0380 [Sclerotinia borealis F-4128]|uniref:Uncharacterized protein n=1 Tax=Sclerotinia borealis (strain F-4128) TaxID=1432307 RepID=W9CQY4_SCLBF|nr:hypothetical protein SBOR_0380 [Sclerotinia borealis F-4128]
MVVVLSSPVKLVGLSQGTANGVQAIVNLQFRKEHSALLSLFEELRTKVDKSSADAERRVEESQKQLEETEKRLKILEIECRDLTQKNRIWEDEVKGLWGKMMKLGELMEAGTRAASAAPTHDRLDTNDLRPSPLPPVIASPGLGRRVIEDLQHPKLTSTIACSQAEAEVPALEQHTSTSTAEQPEPTSRSTSDLSPVSNTTLQDRVHHPLHRHETNQRMSSLTHDSQTSLPPPPSPLAATPANEQILSLPDKPLQKATSREVASRPPWANISQAPGQNIEAYLTHAAEYVGSIKLGKPQFVFIGRFIGGLLDEQHRDALLKQLRKKFSSRVTKDGFVEVRCGFADVGDALMAAGLLGSRNRKRDSDDAGMNDAEMNTVDKKRKTLESQLSEEDDDEL